MTVLNFAAETVFEANTTSGNVSLTRTQLESLVDGNYTTGGVALSGDNILALDVDLGNRIATKDLRYYFSSSSSTTAVASGIGFYYRDYTTDPWSLLTTIYGAGYYTTTSGNFFPREVRVIHTISGTSISGTLREYEVNSNEEIVDYGEDGTLTEKGLEDTPFGTSDPYTIPVYNDGDKSATAYVYIGNTDTDADEMLRISDTQNGTYVGVDDGILIDNQGDISWNSGQRWQTSIVSNKLELSGSANVSYSSGWENIATTLDNNCRPAGIAWHPTDPFQSIIFYIRNQTMYKYELATGLHVSVGTTPRNTSSDNRGGNNDLVYDPVGNRLYYFVWKDTTSEYSNLLGYYYDLDTGLWSGVIVDWDYGNDARLFSIRGAFFEYPGTTNSKDTLFEVGERYIVVTISSGHSTVYRNYRLRLSDHDWSLIPQTGYLKHTGDADENFRATGVCMQLDNLDNYPTGTVAVIWSYAGSSDEWEYINAYAITDQTGVAQSWSPTRLYNISPRDPSIDNWFINEDFSGRGKFFFYDDGADKLYMAPDYNNNAYAVWYNIGGENPSEGYILYRYYIAAVNFFDTNWGDSWLFGDAKRYDGGLFWFMARLYDEQLWMQFPTSWSGDTYKIEGTYTTAVFSNQDPTYWRVKAEIPENTSISTSENTIENTIEVRSSSTPPTGEGSQIYLGFVRYADDYYLTAYNYDGTVKWQYTGYTQDDYYAYLYGSVMAINEFYPDVDNSQHAYAFVGWNFRRSGYYNRVPIGLHNANGSRIYWRYRRDVNDQTNMILPTNAIFASNNMIYVTYRGYGSIGDILDVLDNTVYWTSTIEFSGDQSTLYSMCLAGDALEDIWIIKEDQNEVRRYNQTLQLQQTVADITTGNLNGICEDNEGGFFVGETQSASRKVHRYDENGTFVATYDLSSHVNSIHRIKKDYEGGFWLLDTLGEQIARFSHNGEFIGKQPLLSPQGLASSPLGCWVMSEVYDRYWFITPDVVVDKTNISPGDTVISESGDNWRGAGGQSVERGNQYISPGNLGNDPIWGTGGDLEWSEVSKDTNFVHHQLYHQARITLRSDGSDTPEVEKIALPPAVQLTNIPAQGYTNAYLKTVVASGTVRSRQSGKLRTWFSLEE